MDNNCLHMQSPQWIFLVILLREIKRASRMLVYVSVGELLREYILTSSYEWETDASVAWQLMRALRQRRVEWVNLSIRVLRLTYAWVSLRILRKAFEIHA